MSLHFITTSVPSRKKKLKFNKECHKYYMFAMLRNSIYHGHHVSQIMDHHGVCLLCGIFRFQKKCKKII